jgi:ABC-type bacteriocin/lantibiotic exporter with double-glycine peptidase domain
MNPQSSRQQSGLAYWRWYIFATATGILIAIPLLTFLAILVSPLTTLFWNALMPSLFGFKQISWLQAVGLSLLARLLFTTR